MPPLLQRLGAVFLLLALLMIAALSGCEANTPGTGQRATATSSPNATATQPNGTPTTGSTPTTGGTPSPTPTPATACEGKLKDIVLPEQAVQVGPTGTNGATTSCAYRVPQDIKTTDTFFKTQMGKSGWLLLHDTPQGPLGYVQVYFKGVRTATITLSQHESDTHTTDVTISVEASQ